MRPLVRIRLFFVKDKFFLWLSIKTNHISSNPDYI